MSRGHRDRPHRLGQDVPGAPDVGHAVPQHPRTFAYESSPRERAWASSGRVPSARATRTRARAAPGSRPMRQFSQAAQEVKPEFQPTRVSKSRIKSRRRAVAASRCDHEAPICSAPASRSQCTRGELSSEKSRGRSRYLERRTLEQLARRANFAGWVGSSPCARTRRSTAAEPEGPVSRARSGHPRPTTRASGPRPPPYRRPARRPRTRRAWFPSPLA